MQPVPNGQIHDVSVAIKASIGNLVPNSIRNTSSLKRSLGLTSAKFTFHAKFDEHSWKDLNQAAEKMQDPLLPDYCWKASEQNNRFIRIFPTGQSIEQLFDCKGYLTGDKIGWKAEYEGGYRYVVIGSLPICKNRDDSKVNITDVGILLGRSWNGIGTGSAPFPGRKNDQMFPIIQVRSENLNSSFVPSQCYRVDDICVPAPILIHDSFAIEWRRSHHSEGDLYVHIPCVIFAQTYWNKDLDRTLSDAIALAK